MNKLNQSILITGASSGIGKSLAEEGARLGYDLIITARRQDELKKTQANCLNINSQINVKLIVADVAQKNFAQLLEENLSNVTNLSQIYVNAGVGSAGRFEKLQIEDFKRVLDINVIGAVQTIQGAFTQLKKQKGRIVIIGSLNSHLALPLGAPYNMSKFAVKALAQTLEIELAPAGIKVSIVYPGPVKTDIVSTDNKGRPNPAAKEYFAKQPGLNSDVAARIIIKKATAGKSEFTLNFSSAVVVWLQQHFPRTLAFVIRTVYKKYETKVASMVGQVNPDAV
ncbi:MAG: SDR family NAD(P)-dependent oxidoreductase [Pseudobdellovibrio sp.]